MITKPETLDFHDFAVIAGQYYVAARFSTLTGAAPVGANLMHYAFEFLFKAFLVKRVLNGKDVQTIEGELKRYGHSLKKLWSAVKQVESTLSDSRFDQAVAELGPWWNVRYPITGGFSMSYGFTAPNELPLSATVAPGPRAFLMDVPILDECFHRVWGRCVHSPGYDETA